MIYGTCYSSPEGDLREYRFVERTDFHIAYWAGTEDSFEYTIKTDFDPVPFADKVDTVWGHERGETFDLTFRGRNFKAGGYIRFSNSKVICNSLNYINSGEIRVNITIPEDNIHGGIGFRLYNPDGKFVRIKDAYEGGIHIQFENTKPYARFTAYDIGDKIPGAYYFNGLWSYDWGKLFKESNGPFPVEGTGPIVSYRWDFGYGSPYREEPFTVYTYSAPGTYNVTLTVTDKDGESATITKSIVVNGRIFYQDADADGYGDPNVVSFAYTQPVGYVFNGLDCNDKDPNINPDASEACDGKDNDCDGLIDEDLIRACSTACGTGIEMCQDGQWGGCDAPQPTAEICDGEDNDCDGYVDEDFNVGEPCTVSVGECQGTGVMVCTEDGSGTECRAAPGDPTPEVCDGLDNDCDGTVNNGDFTQYSGTDIGECRQGVIECINGQMQVTQQEIGPENEVCNDGKDNDCDGEIDEPPCADRIVRIADTQGYPGQMGAVVPIGIEGAAGIAGADICFSYDPDVLVAQVVRATSLIKGFLIQTKIEQDIGKICLVIANSTSIEANSGTLVEIIFDVVEFAPVGTVVPLVFEELFLYDENAKLCDASSTDGEFRIVEEGHKGDLNKDQEITSADAIIILQIAVGSRVPDAYQLWAGDVNEDGRSNSADAILVLKAAVAMKTIFCVTPKSGLAGDTVKIIGWNFGDVQDASPVFFADIYVEPTFWSNHEISTTVPSEVQPGQVNIYIDTAEGSSNPYKFTVEQDQMSRHKSYYSLFKTVESAKTLNIPSDIVAASWEQVIIPVEIDDAAGIAGMDLELSFDPAVLSPVDANRTSLTEGSLLGMNCSGEGRFLVSLANSKGIIEGNGALVDLIFEVHPEARECDSTDLIFQTVHLYNENVELIDAVIVNNGQFTVQGEGGCSQPPPPTKGLKELIESLIPYPYYWMVSPFYPQGSWWSGRLDPLTIYTLSGYNYQHGFQNFNGLMGWLDPVSIYNLDKYYGYWYGYQWPAYYWLQNHYFPLSLLKG